MGHPAAALGWKPAVRRAVLRSVRGFSDQEGGNKKSGVPQGKHPSRQGTPLKSRQVDIYLPEIYPLVNNQTGSYFFLCFCSFHSV